MTFLFVGERPSPTAVRMGVTWKDGRLAAKQLFDALMASGIDPLAQKFDNVFLTEHDTVCLKAVRRIKRLARTHRVVAMGRKVCAVLVEHGIAHQMIVHPAARGRIRKKERYAQHIQDTLNPRSL